tara:strand:- start:171 stop:626 length:456 start_codon:yes stop_codon:yes gene_type:complete
MDVRLRLSVWLSTAVFLMFLGALGVQIGGAFAHRADHGVALEAVLDWVPSAIYLYAIWACRSAARRVQRGARFGEEMPALLTRIGLSIAAGAVIETAVGPWLLLMAKGWPGPILTYDPATLMLGAVGALLLVLAGLWRQAASMADELDGFV